jgi:magnesium-transporting ATPase (P-type)
LEITVSTRIKRRSWLGMICLGVVTFGLYAIYWFYDTSREIIAETGESSSAALWTILLFIPFGHFFAAYFYGRAFEKLTAGKVNGLLLTLLLSFFPVLGWMVAQMELNERAALLASPDNRPLQPSLA